MDKEKSLLKKEFHSSILLKRFFRNTKSLFDLKHDTDEEGTVDSIIKSISFRGANLWSLVFAILIASIGLNVNSTAVIIGAMLISPLMGPILGIGLSLGINDIELFKRASKNLSVAVFFSILTSAIYFSITPLIEAQSELLARTQPTIFDVLIAVFGGATGIVAGSRKDKTNAIPGVAIATALMPPLCTAGYGLASGNLKYFFGAFYLFFINSLFISLTTFFFVRYLKFQKVVFIDKSREEKVKKYIYALVIISVLPSIYTGWIVANQTIFNSKVNKFVSENFLFEGSKVIEITPTFNRNGSKIEVTIIGEPLTKQIIRNINNKMDYYGIKKTELVINQPKQGYSDIQNEFSNLEKTFNKMNQDLKISLVQDLYKQSQSDLEEKEKKINSLTNEVNLYKQKIKDYEIKILELKDKENEIKVSKIVQELKVEYPYITEIGYSEISKTNANNLKVINEPTFTIKWSRRPYYSQLQKIEKFLKIRTGKNELKLIHL